MPVSGTNLQTQQTKFIHQLEVYRDRLLDISWRNRSILLRHTPKKWAIDLVTIGEDVAQEAVLDGLLRRTSTPLSRDSEKSDDADELRDHLKTIRRQAELVEQETGLRELYVGFPFFAGRIDPEHYVRAPLILLPVRLEHSDERKPKGWHAEVLAGEDIIPNKALLAALRKVAGIRIPREFFETFAERIDILANRDDLTVADVWNAIQDLLVEYEVPLQAAGFPGPFRTLPTLRQDDEAKIGNEAFHLEPYCVLGSFPQASEALYEDYETLIERAQAGETDQGIVDNLLGAPADASNHIGDDLQRGHIDIDEVPDRDLNVVVETDASQDEVLLAAQDSECTVIRGPPGTGKTQVIVNLISNALAKKQRVMLVCQKRAALDAVYQRMQAVGLGGLALLVSDSNADRSAAYRQLNHILDGAPPDGQGHESLSSISTRIDRVIKELNDLVKPQWTMEHGERLVNLYALAKPGAAPQVDLAGLERSLTMPRLREILVTIDQLEPGARRFAVAGHPWKERNSFASLGAFGGQGIQQILDEARRIATSDFEWVARPELSKGLAQSLRDYEKRKSKWWRGFSGKFRRARRQRNHFIAARGSAPIGDVAQTILRIEAGEQLRATFGRLEPYLQPAALQRLIQTAGSRSILTTHLNVAHASLADFEAIQEYDRAVTQVDDDTRRLLALATQQWGTQDVRWSEGLRQEFVLTWIQEAERRFPQLSGEPFTRYKALRSELAKLLELKRKSLVLGLNGDVLIYAQESVFPPEKADRRGKPETAWNNVRYEINKKRRVWPLRKLISEYAHVVERAGRCWLVSPEVVSEVFPMERGLFDLIIYDEASQLSVEHAIPSLYRGQRIVIAGDEKQLRPFDLFKTKDEDEEDSEPDAALEAESLLMLAKREYGNMYLAYHYRSRHQELIDFSNHAFYGGSLEVAASRFKGQNHAPIRFHRVNGRWLRRSNAVEVSYVVDLIKKTLQQNRELGEVRSIGIITFNDQQRNAIHNAIDARIERDAEFHELWQQADNPKSGFVEDRPFIKNIENVQGDERDIIIFSVGYGPDDTGALHVRFGSLSMEGGENRLNVAVTRAKQLIHVVCSFDPQALRVDTTVNEGPKRFRDYLVYAHAVHRFDRPAVEDLLTRLNEGLKRGTANAPKVFESILEEQVYHALVDRGFTVDTQHGYSGYRIDLAVVHPQRPDRYILAIECDGATFHSARCARERDVARQRFLERMGWKVERVWSKSWWRHRDQEIQHLVKTITALASASPQRIEPQHSPATAQDARKKRGREA